MILPVPRQLGQAVVDCMVIPIKFWLRAHGPVPRQARAGLRRGAGAEPLPWHLAQVLDAGAPDLLLRAEGGLLKGQLQPGAHILPLARGVGAPPAAAAAEQISKDVAEAGKGVAKAPKAAAEASGIGIEVGIYPGKAKLVVPAPLFVVGQDLVGLAHLLEFRFRLFVSRIPVRVILERFLSVSPS